MSGNEDQSNGTQPAQVCALSRERLIELGVSPENIEALTFQPVIRITPTATTLNNGSSNTVHQQTVSNSPPLNTLPNSLSAANGVETLGGGSTTSSTTNDASLQRTIESLNRELENLRNGSNAPQSIATTHTSLTKQVLDLAPALPAEKDKVCDYFTTLRHFFATWGVEGSDQYRVLYASVSKSPAGAPILAIAAQRNAKTFSELQQAVYTHFGISMLTYFQDLFAPTTPNAQRALETANQLLSTDRDKILRAMISQHVPLQLVPLFLQKDVPMDTKVQLAAEYEQYLKMYGGANDRAVVPHSPLGVNQLAIEHPASSQPAEQKAELQQVTKSIEQLTVAVNALVTNQNDRQNRNRNRPRYNQSPRQQPQHVCDNHIKYGAACRNCIPPCMLASTMNNNNNNSTNNNNTTDQ